MAGSLVQVDTFTVSSAVSSVIIGGGSSGSSSYNFAINTDDVYVFTYNDVYLSSDGAQTRFRFTVSGSPDTSSNYDSGRLNIYANQSPYNVANSNIDYISNLSGGTTSSESHSGIWYLYTFNSSSEHSLVTINQIGATETPEYVAVSGGAVLTVNQACDGIQIYTNTGNISNGTFTLYKVI